MKRRLAFAALAGAAVVYVYATQALHGHRCPVCGDLAGHISLTCGHDDEIVCPDCEPNSSQRETSYRPPRSDQVPVTAFAHRIVPTDAGAVIVLRYVAGDLPEPGQLVALHHGPRPGGGE